ncbi:MAG: peptidoglycan DD-metalloendopeptidase family protein, partial [Bacteroidota bacterium]
RRALIEIHEYQADEAVLRRYNDPEGYQEILFSQLGTATYSGWVSHFNFSMIKKRIVMMNKKKNKHSVIAYLIAIPVTLSIVFAFSNQEKTPFENERNVLAIADDSVAALKVSNAEKELKQDFTPSIFPLEYTEGLKLTSHYGYRKDPIDGERKLHLGIDFRAPIGTPVLATADGIVSKITNNPESYGKRVAIDHGDKYRTQYAQLSAIDVEMGEIVKKGQVIAKTGNSGRSTGPHIHYEVIEIGKGRKDPIHFIKDYRFEERHPTPLKSYAKNKEKMEKEKVKDKNKDKDK